LCLYSRSADPVIKLLATSLEGRLGPNGKRFTERPEWKLLQKEEFDAAYRCACSFPLPPFASDWPSEPKLVNSPPCFPPFLFEDITTTSIGTSLFLHTHPTSTPNAQVVSSTLPSSTYTTLIPHDSSAVLESANPIGDGLLLLIYARNVGHELYIYREDGVLVRKVGDQEVLKGGVVRGWGFKRGKAAKEFSLECESARFDFSLEMMGSKLRGLSLSLIRRELHLSSDNLSRSRQGRGHHFQLIVRRRRQGLESG
jgi:hypothetical protein